MVGTNVSPELAEIYFDFASYAHRQNHCFCCGKRGEPELAHLEGLAGKHLPGGPVSRVRERQGISILYGIPLCRQCHTGGADSYHRLGQVAFAEFHFGSEANLLALANSFVLHFLTSRMLQSGT
jgi:hypothetical protein